MASHGVCVLCARSSGRKQREYSRSHAPPTQRRYVYRKPARYYGSVDRSTLRPKDKGPLGRWRHEPPVRTLNLFGSVLPL